MADKKYHIIEQIQNSLKSTTDFPAMSHTISLVSKQASLGSDTSITELTNTILNDFALTNKLLKIVNTVFFIRFQHEGRISTVSKAVHILGYMQVRNSAISLMLFENLQNKSMAMELKDTFIITLLSSTIAKELSKTLNFDNIEEAFICSMFHNLGRLLVTFYLPKHKREIKEIIRNNRADEFTATRHVLGLTYEELGITFAKEWHFSDEILYTMQRKTDKELPKPTTKLDMLLCITSFSNKLCSVLNKENLSSVEIHNHVSSLINDFEHCFKISEDTLNNILESSILEIEGYANEFSMDIRKIPFLKKMILFLNGSQVREPEGETIFESIEITEEKRDNYLDVDGIKLLNHTNNSFAEESSDNPDTILARGIQEIGSFLLGDFSFNEVLRMALEVMFRGMTFQRVFICIRKTKEQIMEGRFGFGKDVDEIARNFRFPISRSSEDVFNMALSQESDILVDDVNDMRIKPRIPKWYRELVDAETFILLPVIVMRTPLGLIYADKKYANEIEIPPQRLSYLKTLRNQSILAIKQRM